MGSFPFSYNGARGNLLPNIVKASKTGFFGPEGQKAFITGVETESDFHYLAGWLDHSDSFIRTAVINTLQELSEIDSPVGKLAREQLDKELLQQIDEPMNSEVKKDVGGIDLNPDRLDLQTQGGRIEYDIPLDLQNLDSVPIDGFAPVIYQIIPVNLQMLIGGTAQ